MQADIVFTEGTARTGAAEGPVLDALAVTGGRIGGGWPLRAFRMEQRSRTSPAGEYDTDLNGYGRSPAPIGSPVNTQLAFARGMKEEQRIRVD
ncbi:hypothetical protein [Streptomyces sp. A012304]|uniref:hypothetical protein n=1 Tax=Streptomyces sp. A012304 TaxID=375446 RepID=UPI00222EEF6C|nr:hypothetical protein [Streptomyces sp. A012304]GKQ41385.1 hypothetical protein ALMP_79020 [Streptomyces sp. A012304]